MSKYTTEVRFICETEYGLSESKGFTDIEKILDDVHSKVFNFEYPIFDTEYKKTLETKILRHYYTREIGEETIGLWKLRLSAKMNEIMPYYNKLYESELLKITPLSTTDITTEHKGKGRDDFNSNDTGSNNGSNSSDNWRMFSDTPQGSLNGVRSENYLTDATHTTDNSSNEDSYSRNSEGWNKNENEYWEKVSGYSGISSSDLLLKYRKTFLNIDAQIIDELEVLFMQLW